MRSQFLLTIGVCCVSLAVGVISCGSSEYSDLVMKCKQVKLGATEDQVIKELGQPAQKELVELRGRQLRVLNYPAPSAASTSPHIYIDDKSGVVIRVVCDDNYTLLDRQ